MLTGQWHPHTNQNDNLGFTSIADIVNDIADRALGGYDDFIDDCSSYPRMILDWYKSDDCPEPLSEEVYQQVMRENDARVYRAIWGRVHNRLS